MNIAQNPLTEVYPMTDADFRNIAEILKRETGICLSDGKKQLVSSRLSKRLRKLGLSSFRQYCEQLDSPGASEEMGCLVKALTTNVTNFFREPHHFEYLRSEILPGLAKKATNGGSVRIWSAGCSGGQEPYTLAMVLLEAMPRVLELDVKILATDIDPQMIERGRRGVYSVSDAENIPEKMKHKYFEPQADGGWLARGSMKDLITFNELNLFKAWPMQRCFDVIFCRNVVIYFDAPAQINLWEKFANYLVDEGHLFIGHSERITGPMTSHFVSRGLTINQLDAGFTPNSSLRSSV